MHPAKPMSSSTSPQAIMTPSPPRSPGLEDEEGEFDFLQFLHGRDLVRTRQLSELTAEGAYPADCPRTKEGNRLPIAVDGGFFFRLVKESLPLCDPFWFLISPQPTCVLDALKADVGRFREVGLEPIFVMAGMPIHGNVECFVSDDSSLQARSRMWQQLSANHPVADETLQEGFELVLGEDVISSLARFLRRECGVQVIFAPYCQWAQMLDLKVTHQVAHLYGAPELLFFDSPDLEVITSIMFDKGELLSTSKAEVLPELFPGFPPEEGASRLLDVGVLTATDAALAMVRPQPAGPGIDLSIDAVVDFLQQKKKHVWELLDTPQDEKRMRRERQNRAKGRAFLSHCPVVRPGSLTHGLFIPPVKGRPEPPGMLAAVFGCRLPPCMYYFCMLGLLPISSMTAITQNYIRDDNPLSDTIEFRQWMEYTVALRTQLLYQLIEPLAKNAAYAERVKVSWVRWFEPLRVSLQRPQPIELDGWDVSDIDSSVPPSEIKTWSFHDIVVQRNSKAIDRYDGMFSNMGQLYCGVLLRSLDLLGYFTHATKDQLPGQRTSSGPSIFAEVMFWRPSRGFTNELVLVVELVRTRALSLNPHRVVFTNSENTPPIVERDPQRQAKTLLVRIACTLDIPVASSVQLPWGNYYSCNVLSFGSMVRAMHRTLRQLVETISVVCFLDGTTSVPLKEYALLPHLLPFETPPSIAAGLFMEYLTNYDKQIMELATPDERWVHLESVFAGIVGGRETMKRVLLFCNEALALLGQLRHQDPETVDTVQRAIPVAQTLLNEYTF